MKRACKHLECPESHCLRGPATQPSILRASARALLRLKRETVLRPVGPICIEEWRACRDIIAEEMTKLTATKREARGDVRPATSLPDQTTCPNHQPKAEGTEETT